jgi:hypothetical protein
VKVRRRSDALRRAVPAVIALLLLSGCSELTPGTASVVNGTKITNRQVDDLSDAQCDLRGTLSKAGSAPASSAARIKQESLGLLMDIELSNQFGKAESLTADKSLAAAFLGQVLPIFKPLPTKSRNEMTGVFTKWAKGRAVIVEAGAKATGQQPTSQNLEQLLNAGLKARDTWQKKIDIDTNPRYAPNEKGLTGGGGDGSVSKATSAFAKGGSATDLNAKWVAALPTSQKCG